MASATAATLTKLINWLQAFVAWPEPTGPIWVRRFAQLMMTARARSRSCASPLAIAASVSERANRAARNRNVKPVHASFVPQTLCHLTRNQWMHGRIVEQQPGASLGGRNPVWTEDDRLQCAGIGNACANDVALSCHITRSFGCDRATIQQRLHFGRRSVPDRKLEARSGDGPCNRRSNISKTDKANRSCHVHDLTLAALHVAQATATFAIVDGDAHHSYFEFSCTIVQILIISHSRLVAKH
jgi:hypothetical protein